MDKILKFAAPWCEPCKALSNIIKDIDLGDIQLEEIDVEVSKDLVAQYRVRSVPTLIYLKEEKPVRVMMGLKTKEELLSWINQ